MKKKLEADLISIAHRILKLKNKSEIDQLLVETQKLYEKLTVLKFVEENFESAKPTIGRGEVVSHIESVFELSPEPTTLVVVEPEAEPEIEVQDTVEIVETVSEFTEEPTVVIEPVEAVIEEEILLNEEPELEVETETETSTFFVDFEEEEKEEEIQLEEVVALEEETKPEEEKEIIVEAISEEVEPLPVVETPVKKEAVQISFEDLMGINYTEAQFIKVEEAIAVPPTPSFDFTVKLPEIEQEAEPEVEVAIKIQEEVKPISLNEKLAKGIQIDLNDRLAFTKHLFGNSPEDYNRVLNQLITLDTYGDTKRFIDEMVKPDYNNWEGKDDYAHRFMEILERKFL